MDNKNKPKNLNNPPIYALVLLGPVAMDVIDRHKSIPAIAVYELKLGPKVSRFEAVNEELKSLVVAYKKLLAQSNAQLDLLDVATRLWDAHLQVDISFDSRDINITETRAAGVVFDSARNVMKMYRENGELPYAQQALGDLEAKYGSAQETYGAAQAGRVAVQEKQHELQLAAAVVQEELIQLRKAVRMVLGSNHFDYQRLRLGNARSSAEPPDEATPATAETSAQSDRTSKPSSV